MSDFACGTFWFSVLWAGYLPVTILELPHKGRVGVVEDVEGPGCHSALGEVGREKTLLLSVKWPTKSLGFIGGISGKWHGTGDCP